MKFRKKPVVIEAFRLGSADEPAPVWFTDAVLSGAIDIYSDYGHAEIKTLEGVMAASPEDWIIRGVKGELYPCKPDIFDATYEPADEHSHEDDLKLTITRELK